MTSLMASSSIASAGATSTPSLGAGLFSSSSSSSSSSNDDDDDDDDDDEEVEEDEEEEGGGDSESDSAAIVFCDLTREKKSGCADRIGAGPPAGETKKLAGFFLVDRMH